MRADSTPTATAPLTSALKGFQALEALAEFDRSVGVSELARELGWTRGTTHRWLVTLAAANWVEQDTSGLYRLTLRVVRVMRGALAQSGIDDRLIPFIEDLAARCKETVSLSVLDGDEALIVKRVESSNLLSVNLRLGSRMPLARTASGMVLAAWSSLQTRDRLRSTGVALPSESHLAEVRTLGFSSSVNELEVGLSAIAVPVRFTEADFLGALSIAAPTREGLPEGFIAELLSVRDSIQKALEGHTATP